MGRKLILIAAMLITSFAGGCQYYRVTDPETRKDYITDNWNMGARPWGGGAWTFTDLKTGELVTLQNTEIMKIDADTAKADGVK